MAAVAESAASMRRPPRLAVLFYWLRAIPFTLFWLGNRLFYALLRPLLENSATGRRSQLPEACEFHDQWSSGAAYRHYLAHLGTQGNDTSWNAEAIIPTAPGQAVRAVMQIPVEIHLLPIAILPKGPAHYFAAQGVVDQRGHFEVTTEGWQGHFDRSGWQEFSLRLSGVQGRKVQVGTSARQPYPLT
jgi:hypothetical protein